MEYTLRDVSNAIANRRQSTFKNVRCFVVNYTATNDFPHKFFYNSCSVARANGTYCARASCEHAKGLSRPMYRFQLQLTDRSPSALVTVTIFEQAHILMGILAEQLCTRSPEAQLAMVREKTSKKESVECTIKVKEDSFSGEFVGVVQLLRMFRVDNIEDEVLTEPTGTLSPSPGLARSSRDFHTPQSADKSIGCSSGGESSSTRRGRGSRGRSSQLSNVKTKFQDLMQDLLQDVIDLTTLDNYRIGKGGMPLEGGESNVQFRSRAIEAKWLEDLQIISNTLNFFRSDLKHHWLRV